MNTNVKFNRFTILIKTLFCLMKVTIPKIPITTVTKGKAAMNLVSFMSISGDSCKVSICTIEAMRAVSYCKVFNTI
jgi:hypothetical protein